MTDSELCSQRWRGALARFGPYTKVYAGSTFAGSDCIVKDYLGIPADLSLPVTFQHGVPTGTSNPAFDVEQAEPLFLATTEEIARAAAPVKPVLRFPHPWLMLPELGEDDAEPRGTLFVGMPSGPGNNERLAWAIEQSNFPRPWSILLKWRGLDSTDFDWWTERGINVQTAGRPNGPSFYLDQRSILARHERIAIPYMSSIAVFAAAMRKPVVILPNVEMHYVAEPELTMPDDGAALPIWRNLLSNDPDVAQAEALRLLGAAFLADKDEMRRQLLDAVTSLERPLHIHGQSNPVAHRILTALWRHGVPIRKLLPTPFHAAARKLLYVTGLNRLNLVRGNEFAHFGLTRGAKLRVDLCRAYQVGRKINLGEAPRRVS